MKGVKARALKLVRGIFDRLPRSRRQRRILLDSQHILTARYLEDFRRVFEEDERLSFSKLVRRDAKERRQCLSMIGCPAVPRFWAKLRRWDLVVLADHSADIGDPCRYPMLRIPHGIGSKLVGGHDYMYGPMAYDEMGRPRYSCIFEASESRRDQFVAGNPALRDVIRLVGHLQVDQLLQKSNPAGSRSGLEPRPRVVFASSWNPNNLLDRMGIELMATAKGLMDRFTFIIRPHPHLYTGTYTRDWKAFLQGHQKLGFIISPPEEDLGDVLASASVIVCDDLSSVILYAVTLNKRIILVPSYSDQIPAGSFPDKLAQIVPNLTSATQLPEVLAATLEQAPPPGLRELAALINSRPGQSTELIRAEVYRLLDLAPAKAMNSYPAVPDGRPSRSVANHRVST